MASSPPSAPTRSRMFTRPPCRARAAVAVEAGAVVADLEAQAAVAPSSRIGRASRPRRAWRRSGAPRRRRSRRSSRPPGTSAGRRLAATPVAIGRAARGAAQRLLEPLLGEHRGVDAGGERAHLVDRGVDAAAELHQRRRLARLRAPEARRRELELDAQADEPLLGAVVEVALDPPALAVGRRDDPRARLGELLERPAQVGHQALVLKHDERVRARRGEQRGRRRRATGRGRSPRRARYRWDLGHAWAALRRARPASRSRRPSGPPLPGARGDPQAGVLERARHPAAQRRGVACVGQADGEPLERRGDELAPPDLGGRRPRAPGRELRNTSQRQRLDDPGRSSIRPHAYSPASATCGRRRRRRAPASAARGACRPQPVLPSGGHPTITSTVADLAQRPIASTMTRARDRRSGTRSPGSRACTSSPAEGSGIAVAKRAVGR